MSPRSILCLFGGQPFESDMLEVAADLAVRHSAHLRCLEVCLPLEAYPELCAVVRYGREITGEGPTLDTLVKANKASREAIERAIADTAAPRKLSFDKEGVTRHAPLPRVTFAALTSMYTECLPCEGRASDLIVSGRADGGDNLDALMTCLFMTGRPLLVVPPFSGRTPTPAKPRKIDVAWDGSLEAARALEYALPLLAFDTRIELLCVEEHGERPKSLNLDGVTEWLAAHAITPQVTTLTPAGKGVGASLLECSEAHEADLLVMGAYGHSHVSEMLLGGTTDHVLKHARRPLLLAN